MKTAGALKSLTSQDPLQWPVMKQVMERKKVIQMVEKPTKALFLWYSDELCKQEALSETY